VADIKTTTPEMTITPEAIIGKTPGVVLPLKPEML
jgi:hypothetical protein